MTTVGSGYRPTAWCKGCGRTLTTCHCKKEAPVVTPKPRRKLVRLVLALALLAYAPQAATLVLGLVLAGLGTLLLLSCGERD